ncbi:MAG: 50S ribosomal protein L18 [Candidatus Omnitrophica bacterium]|nr:50S ribosomal protein L18 [Candidatus Omnitrophota bacterium]
MSSLAYREAHRARRHRRVRKKISGSQERPRLVVRRSHLHLYAQLVDDLSGKTLLSCSTRQADLLKQVKTGGNIAAAKKLGETVAASAVAAGIRKAVFDRGGYAYHGRVKALAEAARAKGLEL